MYRRLVFVAGAVSASGLSAPLAFAEVPKKHKAIYDDEVSSVNPLPGTIEASTRAENTISRAESRVGQLLDVDTISDSKHGIVVHVSKVLSDYVQVAREHINAAIDETTRVSGNLFDRYIQDERGVVNTVASLKDENEEVLPGTIYVVVAGLTGCIISRRRNILLRGITPLIFATGAFAYLLPKTFDNTRLLAWKLEKEQVPEIADKQLEAQKQIVDLQRQAQGIYDDGEKEVEKGWRSIRQYLKDWTGW